MSVNSPSSNDSSDGNDSAQRTAPATDGKAQLPTSRRQTKRRRRGGNGWFARMTMAGARRMKTSSDKRVKIAMFFGMLAVAGVLGWQQYAIEQLSLEQAELWDIQKVMAEALSAQLEATQARLEGDKAGPSCRVSADRI